ncbi:hypothetical protein D3C72_2138640 [compost metagenome]
MTMRASPSVFLMLLSFSEIFSSPSTTSVTTLPRNFWSPRSSRLCSLPDSTSRLMGPRISMALKAPTVRACSSACARGARQASEAADRADNRNRWRMAVSLSS